MDAPLQHSGNPKRADMRRMAAAIACVASLVVILGLCGPTIESVELIVFAAILVRVSFIDLDQRVIPDIYLVAAAVVRLVYLVFAWWRGSMGAGDIAFYALSALGIGAALVLAVLIADYLFGSESMGGGDVKLYAVSAWYFGWEKALFVILLSCVFGVVAAALPAKGGRTAENGGFMKRTLPFGPAIALACFIVMVLEIV